MACVIVTHRTSDRLHSRLEETSGMATTLNRKLLGLTSGPRLIAALTAQTALLSTLPPEPVIPSKKPFKVQLVGGKRYSWCTCGHSQKQPFCDGAHKTKAPGLLPLRFVPEQDTTVWLCGCKHTNNPPYCDGTHKQDFIVSAPLHQHTHS
ncbi:CDGSH iron-sulfur domain-containing protein 3, mitochondrial-like isoform X2 [Antennarius striatus]|uniref:CDGSH iron-sulfur domain-containing protein 3, mitochondrial-like isoform X2 n=1 Tax=Antennarius striatus TaxID=241820 RepID=UPI0035AF7BFF